MANKKRQEWETNRDISRKARKQVFWCWGCDSCLVGPWQKCWVCGVRNHPKRNKK